MHLSSVLGLLMETEPWNSFLFVHSLVLLYIRYDFDVSIMIEFSSLKTNYVWIYYWGNLHNKVKLLHPYVISAFGYYG